MSNLMRCPHCSGEIWESSGPQGKVVNCPHCGNAVTIPAATQASAALPSGYRPDIDTHLIKSILTAIFCCQPLGIVAIVFSAIAESNKSSGNVGEAVRNAEKADKFGNWAIGLGLAYIFVIIVIMAIAAANN